MRSTRWIDLFLLAGLLVISGSPGCDSRSNSNPSAPASLTYTTPSAIYTKGVMIAANSPASIGRAGTSYGVSPALPAGLVLDTSTGIISGTPTVVAATASYTVMASTASTRTKAVLTITVNEPAPNIQSLPNMGQQISPLAPQNSRFEPMNPGLADNPAWLAGQAVTTAVSPDHKTLLILLSGFNTNFDTTVGPNIMPGPIAEDSQQYVFIYDISMPTAVQKQVVKIPNTYHGIVWDPKAVVDIGSPAVSTNACFYVAGGPDDNIHIVKLNTAGLWVVDADPALALGHITGGLGIGVKPCSAGLGISTDGNTLVVVNYFNDSITIFQGGLGNWPAKGIDLDLRPGKSVIAPKLGVPGGEYPFWVSVKGNGANAVAYVSSIRDREIDMVNLGGVPAVTARIAVKGQPNKMTLNAAQSFLYVAEDQSDSVDVIDTAKNEIVETISVIAPPAYLPSLLSPYTGANTNSVTLSPDEKQLYVTNGNLNCIAVVPLGGTNKNDQVSGLIPTGWYPNSVSFSGDGNTVYVVNGKSPTGPNPGFYYAASVASPPVVHANGLVTNLYNPQLIKAGFQSFPRPTATQLATLTSQVAANDRFFSTESAEDKAVMSAVQGVIKHVIFIIKENRTYDQILGDLEVGNGDPNLAEFGEALTPNQHSMARNFVTLDNLFATAETSTEGWPWTTSARAPDLIEHQFPVVYAGRGLSLDSEGTNRNVNVSLPTLAERLAGNPLLASIHPDEDLLAGQTNAAGPDGPDNEINTGYLWDNAHRAGLTIRNYGFFVDTTAYGAAALTGPGLINSPEAYHTPFASKITVAVPTSITLKPFTDPYYRGFDNACPDYFRYTEWARDFDANYAKGGLPALTLVRLMHDHTGNFGASGFPPTAITASDGLITPELQIADNDYAVGLLLQKISGSIYANDTLVFVIEDDSQDGPDHVDSHRTTAFVMGAYVKQHALVSTQYNTLDYLRTIEEVLGLSPMNLNDALARPMTDVFNMADLQKKTPTPWSFSATPSAILYSSGVTLPLPPQPAGMIAIKSKHDGHYWARVTKGMDFTSEDRFDFASYNRATWKGLMGDMPYPVPTGKDLRQNRAELLARYQQSLKPKAAKKQKIGTD